MGAAPFAESPIVRTSAGTGPPEAGDASHAPHRCPRWLLFLWVLLRIYVGLVVCFAPWSPGFWDQNPLFNHFPTLAIYAANGAVRGLVSGIGLLNLWIAFSDAIGKRSRLTQQSTNHEKKE